MKEFKGIKKVVIDGREHFDDDQDEKYLTFKHWEKADKKRIYINDYKRRTLGYIDVNTGENVITDTMGIRFENIKATIARFIEEL